MEAATMFAERVAEIEAYLDLLDALEQQVRTGPPRVGAGGTTITPLQTKILYSGVYLQLYNLVEATITRCLDALSTATADGCWFPGDLSDELRREWVRYIARTHADMSYDGRLESALGMCDHLLQALPISKLHVRKGGGGNWDDTEISKISTRLGMPLRISPAAETGIKQHFRNEQGPLVFVRALRNDLAHGRLSFAECGEGVSASDLRDLHQRTARYLQEVLESFRYFIDGYMFIRPENRPAGV